MNLLVLHSLTEFGCKLLFKTSWTYRLKNKPYGHYARERGGGGKDLVTKKRSFLRLPLTFPRMIYYSKRKSSIPTGDGLKFSIKLLRKVKALRYY